MVRWVVDDPNRKLSHIGEFEHAQQKLTAVPTTFRPIVHIDNNTLDIGKLLLSFIPPKEKPINQKVAGFVAAGIEQECPTGRRFQDAARYQFLLGAHIVIQCFDWFEASRLSASRIFADMDGRFRIHTDPQGMWVRIRQGVHLPDVFEDRVGFGGFF